MKFAIITIALALSACADISDRSTQLLPEQNPSDSDAEAVRHDSAGESPSGAKQDQDVSNQGGQSLSCQKDRGLELPLRRLEAPFDCQITNRSGRLELALTLNGELRYVAEIGAGGAISKLDSFQGDTRTALLSPSFRGEETDRVAQWTLWDFDINHVIDSLPTYAHRFNITQAGAGRASTADQEVLSRVVSVDAHEELCLVDLKIVPDTSFEPEQQPHMSADLPTLVRYQIVEEGKLLVRNITKLGTPILNGEQTEYSYTYIENWNPFRSGASGPFNAIGLNVDAQANVTEKIPYAQVQNYHHARLAEQSQGYAFVYSESAPAINHGIGVVFGNDAPCFVDAQRECDETAGSAKLEFNAYAWNNGLAILPGLTTRDIRSGDYYDREVMYIITPYANPYFMGQMRASADLVRRPEIVPAAVANTSQEFCNIAREIETLGDLGERTSDLGAEAVFH